MIVKSINETLLLSCYQPVSVSLLCGERAQAAKMSFARTKRDLGGPSFTRALPRRSKENEQKGEDED